MDGSIHDYKDKEGKKLYYISYRVEDPRTGEKKQRTKRGFKTKKEAKEHLTNIQHKLLTGSYIKPEIITLGEYLDDWMKTYVEVNLKQSTIDGYNNNIERHIKPYFGGTQLQKLRAANIQEFYNAKLKGDENGSKPLSAKSILYIHRVLSQALKHAVSKQLIPKNVAAEVSPPKVKKYRGEVYNLNEIRQLLSAASGTFIELPITLAVMLGLRRGEVLGMSWNQVNFSNKTVTISQQLSKTSKGPIIDTPKTDSSDRVIPISDSIIALLKKKKHIQTRNKVLLGQEYKDSNLIVTLDDGNYLSPDYFTKKFSQFLKDNKLKHIRFHDLRHSYATMMLANGQPLNTVAELMGHSSIRVTSDTYGHVLDETKRKASNEIDNLIFGNAKSK